MLAVVGSLLEYVFNQGVNSSHRHLLMSLFPALANFGNLAPEHYEEFFKSEIHQDPLTTNFCQSLELSEQDDEQTPLMSSKENQLTFLTQKLLNKFSQSISKQDGKQSCIDLISRLDEDDHDSKPFRVCHNLIDFRYMMLVQRIAKVTNLNWKQYRSIDLYTDDSQGMNLFKLCHFLGLQNEMYGHSIEQQEEIRITIDQLYAQNMWIIKAQFYLFMFGFTIPYTLQMVI